MEVKKSEEILAEIYRNCQLALESISDILPEVDDEELKAEIMRQHEEYERISGRAACIARDKGLEMKEPNPMKKAMMWGSIKMNTLTDNSRRAHRGNDDSGNGDGHYLPQNFFQRKARGRRRGNHQAFERTHRAGRGIRKETQILSLSVR